MTVTFKRGDRVLVSAHGQVDVEATVILASPNGESLMLEFPGGLFRTVEGGAYVGAMPVLHYAGRWTELMNQTEIRITPMPPKPH